MQLKLCFTESGLYIQDGKTTKMMRTGREKGFLGFILLIMTCFKSWFLSLMMSAEKLFPRVTFLTDTVEFHNSPSLFNYLVQRLQYRDVFKCIYFGLIFKKSLIPTPSRLLYLLNWNYYKISMLVIYQKLC